MWYNAPFLLPPVLAIVSRLAHLLPTAHWVAICEEKLVFCKGIQLPPVILNYVLSCTIADLCSECREMKSLLLAGKIAMQRMKDNDASNLEVCRESGIPFD